MRRDRLRLEDILEAIERIDLQIIGEAVRGLSDEIRAAHSDIPWAQIAAMRNILVHDYFGIDLDEVWVAVVRDMPTLKAKVAVLLDSGVD